ncbi:MAG: cytochrome c maturation protein CcmE [Acidimicrobiales bacterium]|nr:cytochrome c maturation protein CcmE [Acidimicrobiales bacterium]
MELTPRTGPSVDDAAPGETAGPGLAPAEARRSRSRRRLPVVVALLVIVGVAGFVIVNALGNATLFFYNADEAVAQRSELGTQRFRLQGTVVGPSVQRVDEGVTFDVTFNGVEVPVSHQGDPPELFQPDIPVVLEGRFAEGGSTGPADAPLFLSDRMLVKHTNEYDAKNEDRLRIAEDGGAVEGGTGQAGTP